MQKHGCLPAKRLRILFTRAFRNLSPGYHLAGAPHLFAEAIVVFLQVLGWPATAIWSGQFGCRKNQDFALGANDEGRPPHAHVTGKLLDRAFFPACRRILCLRGHGPRAGVEVFRDEESSFGVAGDEARSSLAEAADVIMPESSPAVPPAANLLTNSEYLHVRTLAMLILRSNDEAFYWAYT